MKAPFEGAIENIELVLGFAIDSSGSMSWNDPAGLRKQTAKEFVDKMDENDKAAVIDFDDTAKINCALTNDKTAIKNAIDRIYSSGGTDLGEGVRMALTQLQKNTSKAKFIIMLTDGEGSYNHNLTQEAINEGVKIYTIGLGSNIDVNLLKNIEEATGGKYYHASTASDLSGIFEQTSEETIDLTKDEDHVGSNGRTELSNFLIVAANDCGFLTFEEFFVGGFGTDFFNDGITDIALGIGKDTVQSMKAFKEYRILTEKYPNCDFFMTGHSLGGRLVQDVLY